MLTIINSILFDLTNGLITVSQENIEDFENLLAILDFIETVDETGKYKQIVKNLRNRKTIIQ